MKVFVAGASGRVGKEVVKRLASKGDQVIAASKHAPDLEWPAGVEAMTFDLHEDLSDMESQLKGCDAVYFVAGSRGKDLLQVDAFGAVKLMKAAQAVGAKRFVMLSSLFDMEPERWSTEPSLVDLTDYNIAKFFADQWLVNNTDLDWTIVQASILTEEPATGKIQLNPKHDGQNPIPDVAEVLAEVLHKPNTVGKVVMMCSGEEPIEEALNRA